MSKITNDGLTRFDRMLYSCSAYAYGNSGRQRVKIWKCIGLHCSMSLCLPSPSMERTRKKTTREYTQHAKLYTAGYWESNSVWPFMYMPVWNITL